MAKKDMIWELAPREDSCPYLSVDVGSDQRRDLFRELEPLFLSSTKQTIPADADVGQQTEVDQ